MRKWFKDLHFEGIDGYLWLLGLYWLIAVFCTLYISFSQRRKKEWRQQNGSRDSCRNKFFLLSQISCEVLSHPHANICSVNHIWFNVIVAFSLNKTSSFVKKKIQEMFQSKLQHQVPYSNVSVNCKPWSGPNHTPIRVTMMTIDASLKKPSTRTAMFPILQSSHCVSKQKIFPSKPSQTLITELPSLCRARLFRCQITCIAVIIP